MKKRLICSLLILIVAFSLSLSACNVEKSCDSERNPNASVGGGTTNVMPNSGENDIQSAERNELKCNAADFGEKGYEEHILDRLYPADDAKFDDEALITSVNELEKFLSVEHLRESVLFDPSYTGSRDTRYTRFNDKLASYTSEYFETNALIVIFRSASSGSYWYTVEGVAIAENTLNVTLQYWRTSMGTCDMNYWGIIIECPKGNFDKLNVVTEIINDFE